MRSFAQWAQQADPHPASHHHSDVVFIAVCCADPKSHGHMLNPRHGLQMFESNEEQNFRDFYIGSVAWVGDTVKALLVGGEDRMLFFCGRDALLAPPVLFQVSFPFGQEV